MMLEMGFGVDETYLTGMFAKFDADKNGSLNFEEFLQLWAFMVPAMEKIAQRQGQGAATASGSTDLEPTAKASQPPKLPATAHTKPKLPHIKPGPPPLPRAKEASAIGPPSLPPPDANIGPPTLPASARSPRAVTSFSRAPVY